MTGFTVVKKNKYGRVQNIYIKKNCVCSRETLEKVLR